MQAISQDEIDTAGWNWQKLLSSQALWLGAILLSSGLICLLAANWTSLGKWTRLIGLQVLLIATVGLAFWDARRRGTQGNLFLALLMLAAIGIGALLGLVGQTYQTGAQSWQLFAWWALLLLPWALTARRPGLWLFSLVIMNFALVLWLGTGNSFLAIPYFRGSLGSWQLALPNLICLALWHFYGERFGARGKAGMRLLTALALWPLAMEVGMGIVQAHSYGHEYPLVPLAILTGLWLLASVWLWRRFSRVAQADLWVLAIVALGAIGVSLAVVQTLVSDSGSLEATLSLLSIVVVVEAAWVAWRLLRLHEAVTGRAARVSEEMPLSVQIVLGFGAWLVTLFGLGLLLLMGIVESEEGALVFGIILMLISVVILRLRQAGEKARAPAIASGAASDAATEAAQAAAGNRPPLARGGQMANMVEQVGVAAGVAGMGFFGFGLVMLLPDPYGYVGLGLAACALYAAGTGRIIRFLAALVQAGCLMVVIQWLFWVQIQGTDSLGDLIWWNMEHGWSNLMPLAPDVWLLTVGALLAFVLAYGTRRLSWLLPGALAWMLVAQIAIFGMGSVTLQHLPALLGRDVLFGCITLLYAVLPAAVALMVLRSLPQRPSLAWRAGLTLMTLAISLVCLSAPAVLIALIWVWLGIAVQRRWLRVFGTLALLLGLFDYYYGLHVSLLEKAQWLVVGGCLALGVAFVLQRSFRRNNGAPAEDAAGRLAAGSRGVQAGLAGGLLAVLLVANAGVMRYENILAHGKLLLLELAPLDPRALLQGDYMELAYAEDRALRWGDKAADTMGYAVFAAGAERPAQILRLQPAAQPQAEDEVLIPLRRSQWDSTSLVLTGAYFFAEGLEPYFSPARYGEFRVDDSGRSVLLQLRDAEMQPMSAAAGSQPAKAGEAGQEKRQAPVSEAPGVADPAPQAAGAQAEPPALSAAAADASAAAKIATENAQRAAQAATGSVPVPSEQEN